MEVLSGVLAALGIGAALASAPGPVQAVILSEAVRGGPGRALRVVAGAALTFGSLLLLLALGLTVLAVGGAVLRVLQVAGGALLIYLALDGYRAAGRAPMSAADARAGLPLLARGSLAVLLNPGAWLFLGAVAAPLLAAATRDGGRVAAMVTALALEAGTAAGDAVLGVVAGAGLRRLGARRTGWVQRGLAVLLGILGAWLVMTGFAG